MNDQQKPWLILGIGNRLLGDDAVGLVLLEKLEERLSAIRDDIDFVDGGTQGLALLGVLENRRGVIILDAVAMGEPPGTVHMLTVSEVTAPSPSISTAHGSSARELLNAAILLGQLPDKVIITGIEPERVQTGIGLSVSVTTAVEAVVNRTIEALGAMVK